MSYCRWSSDNFKCDVYCYEDVMGGYTTHVANSKPVGDLPEMPSINMPKEEWKNKYKEYREAFDKVENEKIGLRHDGETFNDETLEDFLDRLLYLKEVGYHIPDYVFDDIREEIKEELTDG